MTRLPSVGSVQTAHVGVEAIEEDVLHLVGREYRAVLEVSSLNFALQGEREREATVVGYASFLNALTHPLQILVRILPLDLDGYVGELDRRTRQLADGLAELARDHVAYLRRLARSRTLLERRFYVVVPAQAPAAERRRSWWPFGRPAESATPDAARRQLTFRSEELARQLGRCGLSTRRLTGPELAQLLYACWCPELARIQRLRHDFAEYTALVVRAVRSVATPASAAPAAPAAGAAPAASTGGGRGWLRFRRRTPTAAPAPAALAPDERRFALGTHSLPDLVAPSAVVVARDHLRLDHHYARTLAVTDYPRAVAPGWPQPLIDFEEPAELSLFLHPLDSAQMVSSLSHQMVRLHSSRLLAARGGRLADPEREVAYEDAERLRDQLQRGEEKVFSVSFYVLLRASALQALDSLTRRVEAVLGGLLARSRVALFEQDEAFRSCLPEGRNHLAAYRNLDTSSLAMMFPFSSSTLTMERGVLLGIARDNHSPVIVDPFDASLENANLVVFAKSGAGKSYFTKLLAVRSLFNDVDFLIIDPEDEYRALCGAAGGQYVRLASSSAQHLNPFDLPPRVDSAGAANGDDELDPLAEQVAALLGLLAVILAEPGRPLGTHERAVLDRALYQTYARAGITADPVTHDRPAPLLRDLHAALEETPGDVADGLATRLRRFVDGSLSGLFAGPTNVALDRKLVVFNLQALEPELRPIGVHLITSFVWNQVRRERRPRLLVVDEAWSLMQYAEGGAFLAAMARRARKYWLGLLTITQDVGDFLGSDHGRTVLGNASMKLLLKQDSTTIEPVAAAMQLSDEERQFLLAAGKGEGLFFARGSHLALKIEACPAEHRLATTAPREVAELARQAHAPAPTPNSAQPTGARRRLGLAETRDEEAA